jgi:hypothetical protein
MTDYFAGEALAKSQESRVKEVIVDLRIIKVVAMRTDSVPILEALDSISTFFTSNTVNARRSLRHDLENRTVFSTGGKAPQMTGSHYIPFSSSLRYLKLTGRI